MTYCCGILVREGLVMIADTRTNAGLDNVSTFRKLHIYQQPGERVMALASSGNLSLSQTVRSMLTEGIENPETGELETLMNAPTMFKAAQRIGNAIRAIQQVEGKALEEADVDHGIGFLFGGQIKGGRLRLFMIYSAGNFIECTTDTPYLQIGEHKYGKPVLDRGFDHALEPRGRPAYRPDGGAPRCLRVGSQLSHRAGRALFPGPARALVGGAARRPHLHPAAALSQPGLMPALCALHRCAAFLSLPFTPG
jgi:hypothetical protein